MDRVSRWIRRHPRQRAAHLAVHRAIRDGVLRPPNRCSVCNEETALIAHHEDYARPLDVVWICYWCHYRRHCELDGLPVPERRQRRLPRPRGERRKRPPARPPGRPLSSKPRWRTQTRPRQRVALDPEEEIRLMREEAELDLNLQNKIRGALNEYVKKRKRK